MTQINVLNQAIPFDLCGRTCNEVVKLRFKRAQNR